MKLYSWQEECLQKWCANQYRGIIQAVTGAGKTVLALAAIQHLHTKLHTKLKVKIVVPTNSLMQQWNKAIKNFLRETVSSPGSHISLQGGGYKQDPDRPFVIYVINSARYELARRILSDTEAGYTVLLIADECHHYESGQNSLIFEFFPHLKQNADRYCSLGLSATLPHDLSGSILSSVLGKKIYSYTLTQAMEQKRVSPFGIYHVSLSFAPDEQVTYREMTDHLTFLYQRLMKMAPQLHSLNRKEQFDLLRTLAGNKNTTLSNTASTYIRLSYKRRSLIALASARVECACRLIALLPSQDRIIIFGERIPQTDELYRRLSEAYPGKVGRYHSKMTPQANKNTLQRFCNGEFRILITCKSLDEGLNVPDASVGIILSGTSVTRQRIQRLGRILRKSEGKSNASLYYLHITDTAEDSCFLPDVAECHVSELEFYTNDSTFTNSQYDCKAALLLEQLQQALIKPEIIEEYQRCICLGRVRQDWLDTVENLDHKIQAAQNISEKNYWICMKHISQIATD